MIQRTTIALTTSAAGAVTATTAKLNGRITTIEYRKTDFANGVNFSLTGADSAREFWVESNVNAAKVVLPRTQCHDSTGTAIAGLYDYFDLYEESITVAITNGGDTKTGTIVIYTEYDTPT